MPSKDTPQVDGGTADVTQYGVKEGATRFHLRLDIRGCIHNGDYDWFRKDDGTHATKRESLGFLMEHLAQGHDYLPIGPCDNFDWKTGCQGHPVAPPAGDTRTGGETS